MLYGIVDIPFFFFFFFFFFPPRFCPAHISGTVTRRDSKLSAAAWSCGLVVHCCLPSNSLRFFSFFFSAKILSGPYLWNRYSQRLQIECAAWSCGLIVHCCLPSNSLRYFFFFFFCHDFVRRRVFHLQAIAPRLHTGRPRTCLVD